MVIFYVELGHFAGTKCNNLYASNLKETQVSAGCESGYNGQDFFAPVTVIVYLGWEFGPHSHYPPIVVTLLNVMSV